MNYPIKYAPMQLLQELKRDENGIIEYNSRHLLILHKTKIYHKDSTYSMKYQVVFNIKNTDLANNIYTEQEPNINIKKVCLNSEYVNFISNDFEKCKEMADMLNNNMIILYNPPRILNIKIKEHEELVNNYYNFIERENYSKKKLK